MLGRGSMGRVYHCRDEVAGIEVALKALPPELAHNPAELKTVRRNFQLVEKLHHPHVAGLKTLERDAESEDVYVVMEYVPGQTLEDYMEKKGGKLELEETVRFVRQIGQGTGLWA